MDTLATMPKLGLNRSPEIEAGAGAGGASASLPPLLATARADLRANKQTQKEEQTATASSREVLPASGCRGIDSLDWVLRDYRWGIQDRSNNGGARIPSDQEHDLAGVNPPGSIRL